jgi:hypothetical protein
MKRLDHFLAVTLRPFLIIGGIGTALPLLAAIDLSAANRVLFAGLLDYTASSVPALRHWGVMVGGIGILMVVSAFRPWIRFETMVFSGVEKAFMVFLFISNSDETWSRAYLGAFLLDLTIVTYTLFYFVSKLGRSHRWVEQD